MNGMNEQKLQFIPQTCDYFVKYTIYVYVWCVCYVCNFCIYPKNDSEHHTRTTSTFKITLYSNNIFIYYVSFNKHIS